MYRYNNQRKVLRRFISYLDYAPIVQIAATFFGKIPLRSGPGLTDGVKAAICCRIREIDAINGE
jgi:hypothetical protein